MVQIGRKICNGYPLRNTRPRHAARQGYVVNNHPRKAPHRNRPMRRFFYAPTSHPSKNICRIWIVFLALIEKLSTINTSQQNSYQAVSSLIPGGDGPLKIPRMNRRTELKAPCTRPSRQKQKRRNASYVLDARKPPRPPWRDNGVRKSVRASQPAHKSSRSGPERVTRIADWRQSANPSITGWCLGLTGG